MAGYKITAGMHNSLISRRKFICNNCGMSVPRYPGRYPKACPNCGKNFMDDLDVDKVIEGSMNLHDVYESSDEDKRLSLDKIIQKVNVIGLLDSLVDCTIADNSTNIWLYFAEKASEDDLRSLLSDIAGLCVDAAIYPSQKPDSKWVMSVLNARKDDEPDLSGKVVGNLDLTGDVSVSK